MYDSCPLCKSKDFAHLRNADCRNHPMWHECVGRLMHWQKCATCSHVFTDGYFTPEACAQIFRKTNEHQAVGYDMERQRVISARMVEKVLPYAFGDWLDIGFGNGSLLLTAREYGFYPVGVDLRPHGVDAIKKFAVEAYCDHFEGLNHDARYNVISMADVLEHMPFPGSSLFQARRLMAPKGVILISMPNMDAPVWSVLDRTSQNPYWGEIEHYHNFGRRRLYSLLHENGFEPVRYGISERYRACMEVIAVAR